MAEHAAAEISEAGTPTKAYVAALPPSGALLLVGDAEDDLDAFPEFAQRPRRHATISSFLAPNESQETFPESVVVIRFDHGLWGPAALALLERADALLPLQGIILYPPPDNGTSSPDQRSDSRRHGYWLALAGHLGFCAIEDDGTSHGILQKQRQPRWTVGRPGPDDLEPCRALFFRAFGHDISPALWRWKYDAGRGMEWVARRRDAIVAHYGATVRRILYFGKEAEALQVCDVMVDPEERAVMTRQGVFFQVASAFYEAHFGLHRDHLLTYGFPNIRHMRLGMKLGLYGETERIVEIRWTDTARLPKLMTTARVLPSQWVQEHAPLLDSLWDSMRNDLTDKVVVIRDAAYLRYRYLEHPELSYQFLAVFRRFSSRPLGLAILRREAEFVRLLDIVAKLNDIPLVIDHARRYAADSCGSPLTAWICSGQIDRFASTGGYLTETDVCVPIGIWAEGPGAARLRHQWWLMMGDTEFL